MAHPRFDNLDDEKQEKIIDAAGEEFANKGYEGASINAIIKQAGISKGSLYYYFEHWRSHAAHAQSQWELRSSRWCHSLLGMVALMVERPERPFADPGAGR